MAFVRIAMTFLLFVATVTAVSITTIVDDFVDDADLGRFCDQLEQHYKHKCNEEIDDYVAEKAIAVFKHGRKDEILRYLHENIIMPDPQLDMDRIECKDFKQEIKNLEDKDVGKYLSELIASRGYNADIKIFRVKSSRIKAYRSIRESSSCNLKTLHMNIGTVSKPWIPKFSFSIPAPNVDIKVDGLGDYLNSVFHYITNDPIAKVDRDIEAERAESLRKIQMETDKYESNKKMRKACYMDDDKKQCAILERLIDEHVLEHLGYWAVKIVRKDPSYREFFHFLSKTVDTLSWYNFSNQMNTFIASFKTITPIKALALLGMLVTVIVFYRADLSTFVSMVVASSGFVLIPAISIGRKFTSTLANKVPGMFVTMGILGASLALNASIITSVQAALIAYGLLVFTYNVVNTPSNVVTLLSVLPLLVYAVAPVLDFRRLSDIVTVEKTTKVFDYTTYTSGLTSFNTPDPLAVVAIVICLSMFLLCSYCDVLGYATYKDVVNKFARSKPVDYVPVKPTIADLASASVSLNTIILVTAIALPGVLHQGTWIFVGCSVSVSIILAGILYQFAFFEEYVREGHTAGSTKDRVLESMNIIIGVAPKNVILPRFNSFIVGGLVMMAFVTGCRMNIISGFVLAGLTGLMVHKRTIDLQLFTNWFAGLVITLCGTVPHAIIGMIYIITKVGRKLRFSTDTMAPGEITRDLSLS